MVGHRIIRLLLGNEPDMKHEYTTAEVAKILGRSTWTIKQYGDKGFIKRTPVKGSGRTGMKYIYTEEAVQACADKIGIDPMWEASNRAYAKPEQKEEAVPEEKVEVLTEYCVIRLGEFYLTDNMGLNSEMDKAKRFAVDSEAATQYRDRTKGTLVLIQTIAKEIA